MLCVCSCGSVVRGVGVGGSLTKPIGLVGNGGAAAFLGGMKDAVLRGVLFPPITVLRKAPEGGVPARGDGLLLSLPLDGE